MDTIRKQLVNTDRISEIFSNVRYRLTNERIKTNEKYIEVLIDEINKFFSDTSTSNIDSTVLPSNKKGPSVNSHNNLLINTITDIDKINDKKDEIQNVITKAVNYLSTERLSINDSVSKLQSRILNQKVRLSSNNRNITVFNEYFTDNSFQNISDSNNVVVNKEFSALTLSSLYGEGKNDNYDAIDYKTVELRVILQDNEVNSPNRHRIYPLSNITGEHSFYKAGLGRSVSNTSIDSNIENDSLAGIDDGKNNIKRLSIQPGISDENKDNAVEFEFILNDFRYNLYNSIENAIKSSNLNSSKLAIDAIDNILIDEENGLSFNGSKKTGIPKTDNATLFNDTIKDIGLAFKVDSKKLKGVVSYISILFHPAENSLNIPTIDYTKSYIIDSNGKQYKPFIQPTNTQDNKIEERKTLLVNNLIEDISEVYIAFDISKLNISDIKNYKGMLWNVPINRNSVLATVDTKIIKANTMKYIFVYHDLKRGNNYLNKNEEVLNNIIAQYKDNKIITGGN